MTVQNPQLSKPVFMSNFYLLNLANTLSLTKQVALEHLPYEEGIKTPVSLNTTSLLIFLEHLPYEEGIERQQNTQGVTLS